MPFDVDTASRDGLAARALARLLAFFAQVGHDPSPEQWNAIRDLLDHLERAANGELDKAVYLSAIPAGTGKSTSLLAFAAALMDNPAHADTGALITVNRIAEARDTAQALADMGYSDKVCVYTSEPTVNELGRHSSAHSAQVCVSTQAALKQTLKALAGQPFDAAARFHYRSRRRAVICWDESFAFNRPVTLDADTVVGLAKAMRRQSDEAANALMSWATELAKAGDGLQRIPDFGELDVDFYRLEEEVADRDDLVAQAKGLAIMSGGRGYAMRGDFACPTLITHYPELPPSLMPLIVTDASARVNKSYKQMAHTVPVRWMRQAHKTYHNMTIRIVPTAASRSVYRDRKSFRGRELIDMAVRYIRSVVPEQVLVVSYKSRMVMRGVDEGTIRDAIDARLTDAEKWIDKDQGLRRVHHITWGNHTASNSFKHVQRVILMGLNFLPRPAGYAAAGAALDLDLLTEHPTEVQIGEMQDGMLKDATLQALLRGNARMGANGDCGWKSRCLLGGRICRGSRPARHLCLPTGGACQPVPR